MFFTSFGDFFIETTTAEIASPEVSRGSRHRCGEEDLQVGIYCDAEEEDA